MKGGLVGLWEALECSVNPPLFPSPPRSPCVHTIHAGPPIVCGGGGGVSGSLSNDGGRQHVQSFCDSAAFLSSHHALHALHAAESPEVGS